SQSSPYIVPAGMNFYLLQIGNATKSCKFGLNGMAVYPCNLIANGTTNLIPENAIGGAGGGFNGPPWILGPGVMLTSQSSAINFILNGFLVPAIVETVLMDIAPATTYSVPNGMNLFIMRL